MSEIYPVINGYEIAEKIQFTGITYPAARLECDIEAFKATFLQKPAFILCGRKVLLALVQRFGVDPLMLEYSQHSPSMMHDAPMQGWSNFMHSPEVYGVKVMLDPLMLEHTYVLTHADQRIVVKRQAMQQLSIADDDEQICRCLDAITDKSCNFIERFGKDPKGLIVGTRIYQSVEWWHRRQSAGPIATVQPFWLWQGIPVLVNPGASPESVSPILDVNETFIHYDRLRQLNEQG